MSVKTDKDEEGNSGSEVAIVETNRFGFILGNGETDSDAPCPEIVRHREIKWLGLIKQWDQVMEKKNNKVKGQCQKGIPTSVRSRCWPLLCGALDRMKQNENLYERLFEAPDQQGWTDIIKRDTDRQFPFHEMFLSKDGHGQQNLLQVLKAYTQYKPEEGYCQGQGPVAAVLLMNMPAEEAFWCLAQISEHYLPGYYSPLLEGVLFDAAVLSSVLKKLCPAAHKHLQNQGVEPLMFATDWLMCLYSRHLPFNTLLRVWDLFFCYGVRVLFQVAVVLVRRCLGEGRQRKECDGQIETLERLRGVKERVQNDQTDTFIHEVCSVPLSLTDLQKQIDKEMEKWKKEKPNSTFDPRGRCHGYRMAWERVQNKPKENEKKDRVKGSLTLPLMRSHSSLSPSNLRKKWRKRGSKTDTEEWDGGGRKLSQGMMEESDDGEMRRRSVCGVIGEQRAKQDRLANELHTHKQKDQSRHANISVVVTSSIDSDVFEEEHEETACVSQMQSVMEREEDTLHTHTDDQKDDTESCFNQQKHHSHGGQNQRDAEKITGSGVESKDTHNHEPISERETCQDKPISERETCQDEPISERETCQDEPISERETCQDEPISEGETRQDETISERETCEDELISEGETREDELISERETHEDEPISKGETREVEPISERETGEDEPISERGTREDEPISERETGEDELISERETGEDEPISERETGEDELISERETCEDEPISKGETREVEPISERGTREDEPISESETREDKPISETETHEDEPISEGETRQDELISEGETRDEPISEGETREDEPISEGETREDEPISEGETREDELISKRETNYQDDKQNIEKQEHQNENVFEIQITSELWKENIPTTETPHAKYDPQEDIQVNCSKQEEEIKSDGNYQKDEIQAENEKYVLQKVSVPKYTKKDKNIQNLENTIEKEQQTRVQEDSITHTYKDQHVENINSERQEEVTETCAIVEIYTDAGKAGIQQDVFKDVEVPEEREITEHSNSTKDDITGSEKNRQEISIYESDCDNHKAGKEMMQTCKAVLTSSSSSDSEANDSHLESKKEEVTLSPTDDADMSNSQAEDTTVASINSDNGDMDKAAVATYDISEHIPENSDVDKTSENTKCCQVVSTDKGEINACISGNPESNEMHVKAQSGNQESTNVHVTLVSVHAGNDADDSVDGSGKPKYEDSTGSGNPTDRKNSESSSSTSSKTPDIPPAHLRLGRTSSSRTFYPTILSEDTFRELKSSADQMHTSKETNTPMTEVSSPLKSQLEMNNTSKPENTQEPISDSQTKTSTPKRLGLFRRLRGHASKTPVPKILIQDFSEKEEQLTSKERRRRKREQERKEKEEKEKKKREKEMENDKERERKKPQTRGKSFQMLNRKCAENNVSSGSADSQTVRCRRNSAPFSESYF